MRAHALRHDPVRRFVVILEDGDDVIGELKRFAERAQLDKAEFTGIGAFQDVVIGQRHLRGEESAITAENAELVSLDGGLGRDGDHLAVRADVVVATHGHIQRGRLLRGRARSTLKLVVTEDDGRT